MTGGPEPVFLGVERSFTGKRWHERLVDARLGLTLAQRLSVPEIIGRALAARGVGVEDAEAYLNPTLKRSFPDPRHLIDMDVAVERLVRAVRGGERIAVFGDYDVDGATSSALIKRFFAAVGAEVMVYIPDRLKEGYGPNEAALIKLRRQGIDIVITVDCGISAHGPLAAAAEAGLDVIVVDHHVAEATLPRAIAVINPNRLDEHSPHGALAAVGVAYLLCVAVNAGLRDVGWYGDGGVAEPNLIQWLDLVALGTVCDMVPLTGLNRALASQGLKVLAKRRNTGLAALADVVGLDARPEAWHLGFVLGPRINAGGRVGDADLGVRLLTTTDESEARELATRLDEQNAERKVIEAVVLEQALAQAEAEGGRGAGVVFVSAEGWHPGVIGIVASNLARRFGRPALVVALGNGVGKGSGRSVRGVDLGSSVIAARQEGLLINGGGHPMAAGFTVARDKLAALREFIETRVAAEIEAGDIGPTLMLDGALKPEATTVELVDLIQRLGPFGSGNAEPRFAFPSVRVAKADVVGENHVRCFLTASERQGGGRLKAIAFRCAGTRLGDALLDKSRLALHIAGHIRRDDWMGREGVQLLIDDAAPAHGEDSLRSGPRAAVAVRRR